MRRLQTGDLVVVRSGNNKGKRGKITRVLVERDAVVVEGVNMVKRHLRATAQRPGGILEVEAPIRSSKVMLVDPETGKPTRVRYKVEGGTTTRIAKSGATIATEQR